MVAEVNWLKTLLKGLQVPSSSCPIIWRDNIGAICYALFFTFSILSPLIHSTICSQHQIQVYR